MSAQDKVDQYSKKTTLQLPLSRNSFALAITKAAAIGSGLWSFYIF